MDPRLAIHELEATHGIKPSASKRLHLLAGLHTEPQSLAHVLPRGLAALAAALVGLGVVFWIAANWNALGRLGQFALLQGVVVLAGLAAVGRASWRAPIGLLLFFATGALFAYFGQTYQTGADAWQLFALWAVLTLPLALGARSDLLWAPWALVAFAAITGWVHAHSGHRWWSDAMPMAVHGAAWLAAAVVVAVVSPMGRRVTGAGVWSLRVAVTATVVLVSFAALLGLFLNRLSMTYPLGLLVLGLLAMAFVPKQRFDIYALSAAALGIVTLAVAGVGRAMFSGAGGNPIGRVFVLGLMAAGLLAAAVSMVMRVSRRHEMQEGEPS